MLSPLFLTATAPLRSTRATHIIQHTCKSRPQLRACAASTPPTPEEVDKLFERLNHINKNLRKQASADIAKFATQEEIDRLLLLLEVTDVQHRRAAVQTLGMTGLAAVPKLISILSTNENSTVRASCAKGLAAVALYFPEERATFPSEALTALEKVLLEDQDPVTRLSVIGCLGMLASDAKGDEGKTTFPGCSPAVDVLVSVCKSSSDMAVGASATSAIAQVAQNGSKETKQRIMGVLREIVNQDDSDDEESAFNYVKEIAKSHLDEISKVKSPVE